MNALTTKEVAEGYPVLIDPEVMKETLSSMSTIGHAYWCEGLNPRMLTTQQLQALTALAVETQAKLTTAFMTWQFSTTKAITAQAVNRANQILYGDDFAKVIVHHTETIAANTAPPLAA